MTMGEIWDILREMNELEYTCRCCGKEMAHPGVCDECDEVAAQEALVH